MRYCVHTSDTGKFYILDSFSDSVFCYCGSQSLADDVVQKLNDVEDESVDFTKMH